jgi:hypothetical protein
MNQKENIQLPSWPIQKNVDLLIERERVGLGKYGVTLGDAGLSHNALLQHGLEEALDLANYLQTAMATEREHAKYKMAYQDLLNRFTKIRQQDNGGFFSDEETGAACREALGRHEIEASKLGIRP